MVAWQKSSHRSIIFWLITIASNVLTVTPLLNFNRLQNLNVVKIVTVDYIHETILHTKHSANQSVALFRQICTV